MATYYQQLKPVVLAYLKHYRNDFLKHDRKALFRFADSFILGYRETGTNLLKFQPIPNDAPLNQKQLELVEYFLFRANDKFVIGQNGKIKNVTEEKARNFYNRYRRHVSRMCF